MLTSCEINKGSHIPLLLIMVVIRLYLYILISYGLVITVILSRAESLPFRSWVKLLCSQDVLETCIYRTMLCNITVVINNFLKYNFTCVLWETSVEKDFVFVLLTEQCSHKYKVVNNAIRMMSFMRKHLCFQFSLKYVKIVDVFQL